MAENNWWGTPSESFIQSMIYDWFDDANKALVDYSPYVTAPVTNAPISSPINVVLNINTVSWDPNPEPDKAGYKIYWDTDAGYPYTNSIDAGNVTNYTVPGLTAGSYVAVTSYDADYNRIE